MNTFNWETFLRTWSQDLLTYARTRDLLLPPEVITSGWFGYPGATEAELQHTEARLGTRLPPSYRDFLKVTNGWRQTTPFIHRIWSTRDLNWFPVRHRDWITDFTLGYLDSEDPSAMHPTRNGYRNLTALPEIPDADYFVYGEAQDCSRLRVQYLETTLEISEIGDSAIYLLNPSVITPEGEWEAWFFGNWLPGADRYRSFQELMQAEYENFLELIDR
jgi:SMI1 / KNR4 family (SUKH-1)